MTSKWPGMRGPRRGLMLVTSLFAVLCLYAICAVLFANSQQDLRMQIFSERQTQSDFLADAALNRALREANEVPNWASLHTVPAGTPWWPPPSPQAEQVVVDSSAPASGHCWLEQTSDPNRLIARGVCGLGGSPSVSSAHCLKRTKTDGLVYMLQENPGHLPQAYKLSQTSLLWQPLPPAPAFFWRQPGSGPATADVLRNTAGPGIGKPRFASVVHFPAADELGNFYQAHYFTPAQLAGQPEAARLDYIVRKPDDESRPWEVLPPLPLPGYVNQVSAPPTLSAAAALDADREIYLCAANKDRLIVGQRSQLTDVVTLYRLNNPAAQGSRYDFSSDTFTPLPGGASWSVLPYCPEADWNGSGTLTVNPDRAARALRNLSIDRKGNLYGRLDKASGQRDVLVYCANATGQWSYLPAPPPFAYNLDSTGWTLEDVGAPPDRFADSTVDPDGNFYCVWRRPTRQVDSVFKFCPSGAVPAAGGMVKGTWKVLPSAPRSHYKKDGTLVQNSSGTCPQFESMAIDANGCLYMKSSPFISFLGLALDQVIYSWDCSSGGEKIDKVLPAVPQQITDPDYSRPECYRQTPAGLLESGSKQMAGGGLQSSTDTRIVPVSFFGR